MRLPLAQLAPTRRTVSSPILVAPRELLGKIYDAGISLGHSRDAEMALDLGWPPLCVGLDRSAPELPGDWEEQLLAAIRRDPTAERTGGPRVETRAVGDWELSGWQAGEARILVTSAPLLPRQLARLCEAGGGEIALAFSTGNRITRRGAEPAQRLRAVSESGLDELVRAVGSVLPGSPHPTSSG